MNNHSFSLEDQNTDLENEDFFENEDSQESDIEGQAIHFADDLQSLDHTEESITIEESTKTVKLTGSRKKSNGNGKKAQIKETQVKEKFIEPKTEEVSRMLDLLCARLDAQNAMHRKESEFFAFFQKFAAGSETTALLSIKDSNGKEIRFVKDDFVNAFMRFAATEIPKRSREYEAQTRKLEAEINANPFSKFAWKLRKNELANS